MKHLTTILTVFAMATSMGCSNHNRTSDTALTETEVQSMLQDMEGAQSASGSGDTSAALALKNTEGAIVYVAATSASMKVANIVSFFNFRFLGGDATQDYGFNSISDARVIFIDTPAHESALIIGIKAGSDSFSYYSFVGKGGIGGGKYSANLSGTNAEITIESFDVNGGDLSSTIQLKLYDGDGYLGKVSTLSGFSFGN